MKRLAVILMTAALAALLGLAWGCASYSGLAPAQPTRNLSRNYYYNTSHWPYAHQSPVVKIPAQFAAGLPALPCILLMTPVTVWTIDQPVLSKAVREAEKLYMETPGYALYMIIGTPFYGLKYACWDAPIQGYHYLFEDSSAKTPTPDDSEELAPEEDESAEPSAEKDKSSEPSAEPAPGNAGHPGGPASGPPPSVPPPPKETGSQEVKPAGNH